MKGVFSTVSTQKARFDVLRAPPELLKKPSMTLANVSIKMLGNLSTTQFRGRCWSTCVWMYLLMAVLYQANNHVRVLAPAKRLHSSGCVVLLGGWNVFPNAAYQLVRPRQ